ncbi:MAG: hypothetical protein V7739_20910, partial [Motiliproteus sp.]
EIFDLAGPRKLVIVSLTLVFGIGGMRLGTGEHTLRGIALSAIVAALLNLFLPRSNGSWLSRGFDLKAP